VTLLLGKVLAEYVPTADELEEQTQYLVDGTLLPVKSPALSPIAWSGFPIRSQAAGTIITASTKLTR
jgi:hypothetical protein